MAFVKVEKLRTGIGNTDEPIVTMGAYLADGKAHKSRSINFRFTATLITQLAWPVIDRRIGMTLNEGIDADKGFLQVVYDMDGGRRTTQGEGKQGFSLGMAVEGFHHYVLNECPVSSGIVSHVIDDGALIIECPDWLRYNPASVPEPNHIEVTLPGKLRDGQPNRAQRRVIAKSVERSLRR